jgi:hypothetical protein
LLLVAWLFAFLSQDLKWSLRRFLGESCQVSRIDPAQVSMVGGQRNCADKGVLK